MIREDKIELLAILLLVIATLIFGILLGITYEREGSVLFTNKMLPEENFTECKNMSVSQTAHCLRDYMSQYYNYVIRDDDIKRTLEDIKQNGGDCYDYTVAYETMAQSLGFRTDFTLICGKEMCHSYLVMWDDEINTYCRIDQLSVQCNHLKDET